MTSKLEQPRIVDKRQTIAGTEYLVSTSGEWVPSSTSRCINPELVELYEWLRNSGFREGTTVFASLQRSGFVSAKGARKRLPSSSLTSATYPASTLVSPVKQESNMNQTKGAGNESGQMVEDQPLGSVKDEIIQEGVELSMDAVTIESASQDNDSEQEGSPIASRHKKPRLDGSYVEDLSLLSIDTQEKTLESRLSSPNGLQAVTPTAEENNDIKPEESKPHVSPAVKKEPASNQSQDQEQQQVKEFNRNTEQMIEVYFKEGMDVSGVEMFDTLLGPFRRPTKGFIASFFYSVVLSPLTEPATIEAAIHVLDRTLTIHGPEPFQNIWDVQKRRREVADGTNALSRHTSSSASSSSALGTESGRNTRSSAGGSEVSSLSADPEVSSVPIPTGRLPSWNNIWDLIKAEFGLDTRPESKHHIALQEYHIRKQLQGEDLIPEPSFIGKKGEDVGDAAKGVGEEREVRDEIGRAIVGLLLRILEQDAVLRNVSSTTFFCRDVLMIDPFSPAQGVRQALDVAFQIISLATSSRYLESPPPLATTSTEALSGARSVTSWPLDERCRLNSAGMEILQLGQQFLLLLIRFTEAGELLPGKGLEELAREVLSRLSKVNRDRKIPGSSGSSRSGSSGTPLLLERYNLDQTQIILKSLIQGPCLLDSGTGSGASVKLRHEKGNKNQQRRDGGGEEYSVNEDDYNGILKSQTGICMGSSAFVMVLVDLWFRSKTRSGGGSSQLSFRKVVEEYAMPHDVRPSTPTTAAAVASTTATTKSEKTRTVTTRRTRGRKTSISSEDEDIGELELTNVSSADTGREGLELWSAKDLEQVEWVVMMIEVLVWSWIEARGIRRDEIEGTGLEKLLYPDELSHQSIDKDPSSGWLVMSRLLTTIGGTLKVRWEQLGSVIEAAIMVEDLCLR
ncbi:hypothetical protein EDD21DRAFT_384281 [Dissophora ornata]|nr:hypothetical protein EDD21DRAFT_384281 [Dissophora ornata]